MWGPWGGGSPLWCHQAPGPHPPKKGGQCRVQEVLREQGRAGLHGAAWCLASISSRWK